MKVSQIPEFFARLAESMPNPEGELDYVNMFTLLVAVVLSAQATDKGVNKATKTLFQTGGHPRKNGCPWRRGYTRESENHWLVS